MCLRIGQRQGRGPGSADHHPALEAESLADDFEVRDQMRRRVGLARAFRRAAAAAALVEQHRVESLGVEQPAMVGLAARAGSAMQIDRADAALAADALDIELVAVADGELLRCQRRERVRAAGPAFSQFVIHIPLYELRERKAAGGMRATLLPRNPLCRLWPALSPEVSHQFQDRRE